MELANGIEEAEWREFLCRAPSGNPFQGPDIMRVYSGTRGYTPHVAAVVSHGQVVGLLASVLIAYKGGGLAKLATRAITQGGPLGDPTTFETLLAALDTHASSRALLSEIRNINTLTDHAAFVKSGYSWEDHLDFEIDLRPGESALWGGMSKSRRRGISRADQGGLELRELGVASLSRAYALLEATYARARVPLADVSLFENAMRVLAPTDGILAVGAAHGGELCAVRFVLRGNGTLYDWYAGSSSLGQTFHADEWLVWETLKQGIRRGYTSFRFGGAGRPGEEYGPGEFKRRFGGRSINPGRYVKTYRPLASAVAHTVYRVRRRLPSNMKLTREQSQPRAEVA